MASVNARGPIGKQRPVATCSFNQAKPESDSVIVAPQQGVRITMPSSTAQNRSSGRGGIGKSKAGEGERTVPEGRENRLRSGEDFTYKQLE